MASLRPVDSEGVFVPLAVGAANAATHPAAENSLAGQIGRSELITRALRQRINEAAGRLEAGLTILASVGSTAPFVGLFGTVWGIYRALLNRPARRHEPHGLRQGGHGGRYGWVGKGVALRMRGLGAEVIITEIDPTKALDARMEGFRVMRKVEAAALSDVIITTTGGLHIVDTPHLAVMKDQCILANVGHFNREINIAALRAEATRTRAVRPDVEEFTLAGGRRVYLLANGELINIAVGQGHPAEIMDMTFALQLLAPRYLVERRGQLEPRFHTVPEEMDAAVARLKLDTMGIAIDERTAEQREYDDYY